MKKIYTHVVLDIETLRVVSKEFYLYSGPIAECKSPKAPKPAPIPAETPEERESKQIALFSQRQQLYDQGFEPDPGKPGGFRKRSLTPAEQEEQEFNQLMIKRGREQLLREPGEVSSAQQKALDELYGVEQSKMDEELARFAVEQSGARGLSLGDTPLAREVLLAKQRGQTALGGARAGSKLNFAEKERLFGQGQREWQESLNQQRLANLTRTGSQAGQFSGGLYAGRYGWRPTYPSGGGRGGFPIGAAITGGLGLLAAPFTGGTSLLGTLAAGAGGLLSGGGGGAT